jgi:division protein CdvB (Snf7/Vps24/ESCRT-III family)
MVGIIERVDSIHKNVGVFVSTQHVLEESKAATYEMSSVIEKMSLRLLVQAHEKSV